MSENKEYLKGEMNDMKLLSLGITPEQQKQFLQKWEEFTKGAPKSMSLYDFLQKELEARMVNDLKENNKFLGIYETENEYGATRDFNEFNSMQNDFIDKEEFQFERFIVLAWDDHDACGGLNDYQFGSKDVQDALNWIRLNKKAGRIEGFENYQIFDRELGREVLFDL